MATVRIHLSMKLRGSAMRAKNQPGDIKQDVVKADTALHYVNPVSSQMTMSSTITYGNSLIMLGVSRASQELGSFKPSIKVRWCDDCHGSSLVQKMLPDEKQADNHV